MLLQRRRRQNLLLQNSKQKKKHWILDYLGSQELTLHHYLPS